MEAYFQVWPNAIEKEWLKVWVDVNVLHVQAEYPVSDPIKAATLPCNQISS